jgi:phosphoribosyl-dephospho-CoA transferase
MQPSNIATTQVHDLLQLDPDSLQPACIDPPNWVIRSLASCPWVVVRRAQAPNGQIAVGVRGSSRSERWGCFVSADLVCGIVSPAELLAVARSSAHRRRTLPFKALQRIIERWSDLSFPWGPTGSVGFELATGRQVTTEASDLDVAIFAADRFSVEQARSIWELVIGLETKVDVRVETPRCGFLLHEYAHSSTSQILRRYPDGPRFGGDPWGGPPNTGPIA